MWPCKAIPKTESKKRYSELTIYFYDGHYLGWTTGPLGDKKGAHSPWLQFIKWFHVRTSPSYTIFHKDGRTTFKRADIKRFHITATEGWK
jgi:hypothetical protein